MKIGLILGSETLGISEAILAFSVQPEGCIRRVGDLPLDSAGPDEQQLRQALAAQPEAARKAIVPDQPPRG